VEERELTVILIVDVSGSGLFGSGEQSKRELAAEIASVLAFSAIRNNDKVGLILFTDEVEKFIPPRKGRRHVLRVIREILFFEPQRRGTDLNVALQFLNRVTPHRAVAVILSDFLEPHRSSQLARPSQTSLSLVPNLVQAAHTALRQANRRHDVVAVHITDRYELTLPALGRLVLKDAETGEVIEINTLDSRKRERFAKRQEEAQAELVRLFRSMRIDSIAVRTDQAYAAALGRFFETREKRRRHG
ncbi:MAG TPA: VWA domain-containing protein, partial [Verrucomicrobiae bacterium]|nr:VWA domain-containing protein [Verrucomicrobiae bacterium]